MVERRARGGGRGWAVGLSLLAHGGVLGVLAWTATPRTDADPPPTPADFIVVLAPAPRATTRPAIASREPPASAPASRPALQRRPEAAAAQGSSLAAPLPARPDAESGGDVRGFLRATLGCSHRDAVGLTPAERERCSEIAGAQGRAAPDIDPIPAEKLAYYDAVAKAYAELHYATPVARQPAFGTGAAGAFADPPTAMPGRMPGIGCRILFGKPRGWKPPAGGVPHALNLGPCFVSPPKGPLDPEVDLPSSADIPVR